jgi:hypothetical protein
MAPATRRSLTETSRDNPFEPRPRSRRRPPHDGARRARVTGAQNRRTGTDLRGDSDAPASQDVRGVTWWAIA